MSHFCRTGREAGVRGATAAGGGQGCRILYCTVCLCFMCLRVCVCACVSAGEPLLRVRLSRRPPPSSAICSMEPAVSTFSLLLPCRTARPCHHQHFHAEVGRFASALQAPPHIRFVLRGMVKGLSARQPSSPAEVAATEYALERPVVLRWVCIFAALHRRDAGACKEWGTRGGLQPGASKSMKKRRSYSRQAYKAERDDDTQEKGGARSKRSGAGPAGKHACLLAVTPPTPHG